MTDQSSLYITLIRAGMTGTLPEAKSTKSRLEEQYEILQSVSTDFAPKSAEFHSGVDGQRSEHALNGFIIQSEEEP